jgi:hypothetical protein
LLLFFKKEESSFLKNRSKRLLLIGFRGVADFRGHEGIVGFVGGFAGG